MTASHLLRVVAVCSAIGAPARALASPPAIEHVFIIVLENKGFEETFGTPPSGSIKDPYLRSLAAGNLLLRNYYAIGHVSLDNYIAMVSGQAPNLLTQGDCVLYLDFVGAPTLGPDSQAIGQGCVYPPFVKTIVDQLAPAYTWKAYMEDMGNDPVRDGTASVADPTKKTCGHPALNSLDETQLAQKADPSHGVVEDQYAARHNPFVYFHSIIDDAERCDAHVVPLDELESDLAATDAARASLAPNFVFITPNLCNDGHDPAIPFVDTACVDGAPGGLISADAFLGHWVPKILASPAFEKGLLVITFDEADVNPFAADGATSCCDQQPGFNTVLPGIFGPGGGRTGAVLASPFIKPGRVSCLPYNHYSLLRSLEDVFGVEHLGYAAREGLVAFGDDVYASDPPETCAE